MQDMIMKILQPEVVKTIFWSGFIFLLLCQLLGIGILNHFFSLIAERDERTVGDSHRAVKKSEEASSIQQKIESQLIEARIVAMQSRDSLVRDGRSEHDRILSGVTVEYTRKLASARNQIADIKTSALSRTDQESTAIASAIVSRLLSVGPDLTGRGGNG